MLRILDEDAKHILIRGEGDYLREREEERKEKSQWFGYLPQSFLQGMGNIFEVEDHQRGGKDREEGDMTNRLEGEME